MKKSMFLAAFVVFAFYLNLLAVDVSASSDFEVPRFHSGLYLDGIGLGNYTYAQALDIFTKSVQQRKERFLIKVNVGDQHYDITADDIYWECDTIDVLTRLMNKSLAKSYIPETVDNYSTYTYNTMELEYIIDGIIEDITGDTMIQGVDGFNFDTKQFVFKTNATGYTVDRSHLKDLLEAAIKSRNQWDDENQTLVFIEAIKDDGAGKVEQESDQYGLLSTYTTYTTNVPNRNTNIMLAADSVNRSTLEPDEVFSYLRAIGSTTAERGYKMAGILVRGKPAQGMGGGICQLSSTMYNTVLDAGLEVVERHPHSAPVDYVPKNRDATVSFPNVDFRFKNNTSSNIYIEVYYNSNALTVSLYGKKY